MNQIVEGTAGLVSYLFSSTLESIASELVSYSFISSCSHLQRPVVRNIGLEDVHVLQTHSRGRKVDRGPRRAHNGEDGCVGNGCLHDRSDSEITGTIRSKPTS